MPHDVDANGLNLDRPGTISTWTGKHVDPLDMSIDDLDIADIAHALARQCRYNGHCAGHLSVARHSIWVSEYLESRGFSDLALWGLLHDAAEAYLGDIPSPFKASDEMALFRAAEYRLEEVIADTYGLVWPMPDVVKEADRWVLVERELRHERDNWGGSVADDEAAFLARFKLLRRPAPALIVGLSGYAQSGKDTVGQVLVEHHGFARIAFADALRDVLYDLNPLVAGDTAVSEWVDHGGWEWAKGNVPVRDYLQRLGVAVREHVDPDVWVNAALRQIEPGGRYVITDMRFPNEYDAIVAAGGEAWRVERKGVTAANAHVSETALDAHDFRHFLYNQGDDLERFRNLAYSAGEGFLARHGVRVDG